MKSMPRATLCIPEDCILDVFTGRTRLMREDLPDDVEVVTATASPERGGVILILESAHFEEVPDGAHYPMLINVRMQRSDPCEAPTSG